MNTLETNDVANHAALNQKQAATANSGAAAAKALEKVKHEIFAEYQPSLAANEQLLRLALIEADNLARQTEHPHLFYPILAEEKAQNAARWQHRQQYLLRSNSPYALAA